MCIMCHLADTPIYKNNLDNWLLYYNTYPMGMYSGVILPYNHTGNYNRYNYNQDADAMIDMGYYQLPGDTDNTSIPTF